MKMKQLITLLKVLLCALCVFNSSVFAQPSISYGVSGTKGLAENSAMTDLTPSNSGSATTPYYKSPTTVATGLSTPTDVMIDYYSKVYVGNSTGSGGITFYDGSSSTKLGSSLVNSLGINKLKASPWFGYIYFTTVGSTDISYYDNSSPRVLTTTNAYNLTAPTGIAVDYNSTFLYVIDSVQVYQLSLIVPGAKTLVTGISGTPVRITNGYGTVWVFTSTGNLYFITPGSTTAIQPPGGSKGVLGAPWFAIDASYNAYLTLTGAALVKSNASGSTTLNVAPGSSYAGVGIDNANNIYVANRTTNSLEKYTLTNAFTVSPALPTGLSIDPTLGTISGTPTVTTPATTYTVTAGNQSADGLGHYYTTATTTISLTTQPLYTWLGTTSSFSSSSNWFLGAVPTGSAVLTIPSSASNQPILDADLTVSGIDFIGTGGTLDMNGHNLTINGSVTGTGSLKGSATSSLVIGGSVGTINFDAASNSLKDLTINSGSLTLGNTLNLYGKLNSVGGTFNTGGFLKLKSVSTGTAVVESVTGTITGSATVERYIPQGYMAFRDLGVCVSGAGTIASSWGQSLTNYKTYSYNGGNWVSVANTASPLKYAGYRLLVTGNQNPVTPPVSRTAMNSAVTLAYSGSLLTGTQTIPLESGADKFSFISNPYASQVDFDALTKSGLYGGYWCLDPVNVTDSNFENYNYYGTGLGVSNKYAAIAGKYIQPGQAFFVCNQSASSSLAFTEIAKNNTTSQTAIFGSTTPLNRIATGLFANGKNLDGAVTVFNGNFSNSISTEDGLKINNPGENMAFSIAGKDLCANGWNIPSATDVMPIHFYQLNKNKSYTLRIDVSEFSVDNTQAYLFDNVLNKKSLLVGDSNIVAFTTTTDTAAFSNRYSIVFKVNPLPIKDINISAILNQADEIAIKWKAVGAVDILNYKLEHSINGVDFTELTNVFASTSNSYNFIDASPLEGINYYRIKATDVSGKITYSTVVNVQFSATNSSLKVFPNPVTGNTIKLHFGKNNVGNYTICVINQLGQTVSKSSLNHSAERAIESITIKQHLPAGSYTIKAIDATNNRELQTQAIVK